MLCRLTAVFTGNGTDYPAAVHFAGRCRIFLRSIWHCRLFFVCALIVTLPVLAAGQSSSTSVPRIGLLAWGVLRK